MYVPNLGKFLMLERPHTRPGDPTLESINLDHLSDSMESKFKLDNLMLAFIIDVIW